MFANLTNMFINLQGEITQTNEKKEYVIIIVYIF